MLKFERVTELFSGFLAELDLDLDLDLDLVRQWAQNNNALQCITFHSEGYFITRICIAKILSKIGTTSAVRPLEKVSRRHFSRVTCTAGSIFRVVARMSCNWWPVMGPSPDWIWFDVCTLSWGSDFKAQAGNFDEKSYDYGSFHSAVVNCPRCPP
jgi:hypothetical protein